MENTKLLIIIDGNAILHRAYHALPPLTTEKGEPISAVFGYLLAFFKAIKELQPDYIAATFDLPAPTFRHKIFKDYKSTRPKTPEEFYLQIPKIKEILKGFNVPIFEKEGYEADDVIGTIACLAVKRPTLPKIETIILSSDLDILQLVNAQTKAYFLRQGVKNIILYDEKAVKERYQGLRPSQLPDYKSLKGDSSDNIPGVPGIGEKNATEIIRNFGSIENLYHELESGTEKSEKLKTKTKNILIQLKEQVFFSKMLATIKKNVKIDFKLQKCAWGKYDRKKISQLFKKFGFSSLINRLP